MKEAYTEKFRKHWADAKMAMTYVRYRAVCGYLYGDAVNFQQDCKFYPILDGKNHRGHILGQKLEEICLSCIHANDFEIRYYCEQLDETVRTLLEHLESQGT
ncbi:MAG: hypothetical protein IKD76_06870 [Clostridia bacterium]|nr:hypothetical protein [Clostridia bacterium]